jgi:Transposase IS116/IS110/IS902 family
MHPAIELLGKRARIVSPAERYSKLGWVYGSLDLGLFLRGPTPLYPSRIRSWSDLTDWPDGPACRERPFAPCAMSTWGDACPGGLAAMPVGSCAWSASTGIDRHRGGPAIAHITAVAARLKLVNQQIKQAHRQLDELSDKLAESREEDAPGQKSEQRDVTILRSLPGVGRIVLATLLAEAAGPLRKRDYHALRTLSGVTRRSGKRCVVLMRQACHLRLRTAVYHWARVAIQHDARSRARYAELRKRGHSHGRALRSVADRLLAVACAMLKTQTTFNPQYALGTAAA